jgi:hypothetical protein
VARIYRVGSIAGLLAMSYDVNTTEPAVISPIRHLHTVELEQRSSAHHPSPSIDSVIRSSARPIGTALPLKAIR